MLEWVITLSVFCYMIGTIISVLEEWTKQGLTDTSYLAIILWILGAIGITVFGAMSGYITLSVFSALSAILCGFAIKLKLTAHRHFWKGLSYKGLRHRG